MCIISQLLVKVELIITILTIWKLPITMKNVLQGIRFDNFLQKT